MVVTPAFSFRAMGSTPLVIPANLEQPDGDEQPRRAICRKLPRKELRSPLAVPGLATGPTDARVDLASMVRCRISALNHGVLGLGQRVEDDIDIGQAILSTGRVRPVGSVS
jgi:hypothetical protein